MNLEDTSDSNCSSPKDVLSDGETASDVVPVYRRQYGGCTTSNEGGESGHNNDVARWKFVSFWSHSTRACSRRVSRVFEAAMRPSTFVETRLNLRCLSHGRVGIADERPTRVEAREHCVFCCVSLGDRILAWGPKLRRKVRGLVQP